MVKGHQDKKLDTYRQTRLLMFTMVRLMGDPKSSPKTPEALWELPGDAVANPVEEAEEYKKIFERLGQWQKPEI
jgi:hypothetical protein